ncbi:MAG: aminotransferase class III-fold pyridoxal phosphate-dependent enzyme, partial [Ilumatobacteraceae bacterium]
MTIADTSQDISAELSAKADRHLWGHFARHGAGITPPIITRGEGVRIWDSHGKSYLDGLSGLFVVQVGHGRAELAEAAARQAKQLEFFPLWSYATPPAIELAERLVAISPPGLTRVFYSDSGSTAVEIALKMAFQWWAQRGERQRTGFICLQNAYHGDTIGAVSVGGIDLFHSV